MLALLLGLALAQEPPAYTREGWGFGGLPALNYNTDEGFGFGAVGSVYRYDGETSPYKLSTTLILFMTTKGIHLHRVDVDALQLLDGKLRFTGRVQLDITRTNNFCGLGADVTCDPAIAEAEAEERGLEGEAAETFVRRYYLSSYVRPNLFANGRWKLDRGEGALKTELMTILRVVYHLPGNFSTRDPDPGNLIGTRLDEEQGLLVQPQLGLMIDSRDFEPAPARGIWAEASVRGAAAPVGAFTELGWNLTWRGYVPLVGERALVSATRLVHDGLVGDVPIRELAQMGGSQLYEFGGGLNAGRGVRQRRYLGRVKGLAQEELRWRFAHVEPFGVSTDFTLLGFTDLMLVAEDWASLDELARPIPSYGGGLRLAFDDSFIIRVDVGVSPVEDHSPSIYIDLGNLY